MQVRWSSSVVHDFVLIQEHWQWKANLTVFQENISGISSHGVSAMDDQKLLIGRPHGGIAILWRSNLRLCVTPIPCDNNRICAVKVSLPSGELCFLLVNVYMPVDVPQNKQGYTDVLHAVSAVCENEGEGRIIFGGDFNTDFMRQSQHREALNQFMADDEISESFQ